MSEHQYHLTIQNGKKSSETGFFFPASPFIITTHHSTYKVIFTHTPKHEVIYNIIDAKTNTSIHQLTHPYYAPENASGKTVPVTELKDADKIVFAALGSVNIMREPDYRKYFEDPNISENLSFEIQQAIDKKNNAQTDRMSMCNY